MTDLTSQQIGVTANPVARFFGWIWNGLVFLAENSSRAQALRKLSETSDEELAARGVTRDEIVRKMFADRYYM